MLAFKNLEDPFLIFTKQKTAAIHISNLQICGAHLQTLSQADHQSILLGKTFLLAKDSKSYSAERQKAAGWWLNHPSEKYARQIRSFPQGSG